MKKIIIRPGITFAVVMLIGGFIDSNWYAIAIGAVFYASNRLSPKEEND